MLEADSQTMIESPGNPVWRLGVAFVTVLTIAVLLWQSYVVLGY